MDTTKQNILMCEKAEKYLPKWTHKDIDEWDYLHCKYSEYGDGLVHPLDILCGLDMESWTRVYRQDQLQDMVFVLPTDKRYNQKELYNISFVACPDTIIIALKEFSESDCEMGLKTMEQLWLAFVMKEKYNKIWNGKDWVKC